MKNEKHQYWPKKPLSASSNLNNRYSQIKSSSGDSLLQTCVKNILLSCCYAPGWNMTAGCWRIYVCASDNMCAEKDYIGLKWIVNISSTYIRSSAMQWCQFSTNFQGTWVCMFEFKHLKP